MSEARHDLTQAKADFYLRILYIAGPLLVVLVGGIIGLWGRISDEADVRHEARLDRIDTILAEHNRQLSTHEPELQQCQEDVRELKARLWRK